MNIVVECVGWFAYEGILNDEDRKVAHAQAYMLLFPYVQNEIAQLVMSAGLPPLMIRMGKIDMESVKIEGEKL